MSTSTEAMRSLVSRLEDAMNERDLDALEDIVAADFVRHCEATPHLDIRDLERQRTGGSIACTPYLWPWRFRAAWPMLTPAS